MIDNSGRFIKKIINNGNPEKDEIYVQMSTQQPAYNINIDYANFDDHEYKALYNTLHSIPEKERKKEPLIITEDVAPDYGKYKTIVTPGRKNVEGSNLGLLNEIEGIANAIRFREYMPDTILYQRYNGQDNDSIYRIKSNTLLNGLYDKNITYRTGLYRIIEPVVLNKLTSVRTKDNINCGLILNNQLLFGYFLNSVIFSTEGIIEKPKKKSIAYEPFVLMMNRETGKKSPIESYEDDNGNENIIYKTSELSRIKSDDHFQTALRICCDHLGYSFGFTPLKIAKRQIKLAYGQKLLYSFKESNKVIKKEYTVNKVYEQIIGTSHIKTFYWNMCCGESFTNTYLDNEDKSFETIQLNQRVENGLKLLKTITNSFSELWIVQYTEEFEHFQGILFQILNTIVVEVFDLQRLLNDKQNLEELIMDPDLISIIKEFGEFIKRILKEGINTTSYEGLKIISITNSFVSPVVSSFGSINEFKDIHFEVFYVIDQLFNNRNFTRILFRFLSCYYKNYSSPESILKFKSKLSKQFPYRFSTLKKLSDGYNLKEAIKLINDVNECYLYNNLIDIANVFYLSPFSVLSQISLSSKSMVYRCLKMSYYLNSTDKNGAITYMNNIWKSRIVNMPWTSFQVYNKKIVNSGTKGNSRLADINMFDVNGDSIKLVLEKLVKEYKIFIKGDESLTSIEYKLLRMIENIYDNDYNFIYFNRELTNDGDRKITMDSIRIPFTDLKFSKFGFMFCSSSVQPKPIIEFPICYHYSMIPELEMELVGVSDSIYTKDNKHPVHYKFPYIAIYDKPTHLHQINFDTECTEKTGYESIYKEKAAEEKTKKYKRHFLPEDIKSSFNIYIGEFTKFNPYIELCGLESRRNISPLKEKKVIEDDIKE